MKEESGGSVTVFSPAAEEARISTKYIREWIGRYGGGGGGGEGGRAGSLERCAAGMAGLLG